MKGGLYYLLITLLIFDLDIIINYFYKIVTIAKHTESHTISSLSCYQVAVHVSKGVEQPCPSEMMTAHEVRMELMLAWTKITATTHHHYSDVHRD